MSTYRWLWRTACAVFALIGGAVALGTTPGTLLAPLTGSVLVLGALGYTAAHQHQQPRTGSAGTIRGLCRWAVTLSLAALALLGLAQLLGIATLPLVMTLAELPRCCSPKVPI